MTWALQALDDRDDKETRARLEQIPSPFAQVNEAVAILGQDGDFQVFPVTAAGADEFVRTAQKIGLGDQAKAHLRRYI